EHPANCCRARFLRDRNDETVWFSSFPDLGSDDDGDPTNVGVSSGGDSGDLSRRRVHAWIVDAPDLVRAGGRDGGRLFLGLVSDVVLANRELGHFGHSLLFSLPVLHARWRRTVERRCDNRETRWEPH